MAFPSIQFPRDQEGVRTRVLHFPGDWTGDLRTVPSQELWRSSLFRPVQQIGAAQGEVVVRLGPDECLALAKFWRSPSDLAPLAELQPDALEVLHLQFSPSMPMAMPEEFRHLGHLSGLLHLSIFGPALSDHALSYLESLNQLQHLFIDHPSLTGTGFHYLRDLTQLRHLSIWHAQLEDKHLVHLANLPRLEHLDLWDVGISDAALEHFRPSSPLRFLFLMDNPITNAGLAHLESLTGLEEFSVSGTHVTDSGLRQLRRWSNLRILHVRDTWVSNEAEDWLKLVLPACKLMR
jgi:hypothetical protein